MVEMLIGTEAREGVVLNVLERLRNGRIEDAIACFAEEFSFKDHGVDLEFKNKERLAEFFRKARELYPDSSLQTNAIFVSGEHVITEWVLQYTIMEPFYMGKYTITQAQYEAVIGSNPSLSKGSQLPVGIVSLMTFPTSS